MHKSVHGDAIKLMKNIKNNSIDLIHTDPPYKNYQSQRTIKKQKEIKKGGFSFEWLMNEVNRVLKPGKHFYIWCDAKTFSDAYVALQNTKGLVYKNMIIWVKNNHGSGDLKSGFAPQHEICIFGHKGKGIQFYSKRPSDVLYKKSDNGCISFYNKVSASRAGHPTVKPHEIIVKFIEASTKKGEVVLDMYAGSFSTAKAAKDLGRKSISFELNKNYFSKFGKI
uniref:DNA methylase N-4/N-6 domain-containing protein n=1 Tax=viral metagenome TaxID=1070528 RepID=A0A6C0FD10_9ZZZZ|tara:strand:- start:7533 stop:8201 length:669 start_codon:yes stop_codon:yes gene_type:complete